MFTIHFEVFTTKKINKNSNKTCKFIESNDRLTNTVSDIQVEDILYNSLSQSLRPTDKKLVDWFAPP